MQKKFSGFFLFVSELIRIFAAFNQKFNHYGE